jgi:hypothetical protein
MIAANAIARSSMRARRCASDFLQSCSERALIDLNETRFRPVPIAPELEYGSLKAKPEDTP